MSCHNIGAAMDSVVEKVVELYDEKEISISTARSLIITAKKGVNYCDGNEYEAVESMRDCRCGCCLKKFEQDEFWYSLWDLSEHLKDPYGIIRKYNSTETILSECLCEECFTKVITEYTGDPLAAKREMEYQRWNAR